MINRESRKNKNEMEENKHSDEGLINADLVQEINLSENEIEEKTKDISKIMKYKISVENIQRKIDTVESINSKNNQYSKKSQIIVISRKRPRDDDLEGLKINENSKSRIDFDFSNSDSKNSFKKIKFDNMINFNISKKIENLDINFDNLTEERRENNIKASEQKIKNRNLKNFNEPKCKMCSQCKTNSDLYKNYYPIEIPSDYSTKIKKDDYESKIEESRKQISECRQLKFLERRKLLNKDILNDFSAIQHNYNKLFGDFKIINEVKEKDKIIIVNRNLSDKKAIEEFFETNMKEKPEMQVYECSDNFNDSDIMNLVIQNERENVVLDGELGSESDYNPLLDYDSNREDNIHNDYPDEIEDDDDFYDYDNLYDNNYYEDL